MHATRADGWWSGEHEAGLLSREQLRSGLGKSESLARAAMGFKLDVKATVTGSAMEKEENKSGHETGSVHHCCKHQQHSQRSESGGMRASSAVKIDGQMTVGSAAVC